MHSQWKKLENENGFPFYLNEATQQKQWDHPKFFKVKQAIDECNYVKYSKYRMALKFRALQRALFTENISLQTIVGVFAKHQLGKNESTLCLESYDLEAVLYDIYFAATKQKSQDIDVDFAVELMQNFLYNIYDKNRQNVIQVFSTKLVLALLSDSSLTDLYHFLFTLCADHNNCVTRLRLQSLLSKLVEIFLFMHEDVSFGQHLVNSNVEGCFSNSPGLVGISEHNFKLWMEDDPQLLCWISILSRIKSCEMLIHNVKCSTCKCSPLIGLMYRCLKCSKYTQCQKCFFMGKVNNSHKLSHSMREYSVVDEASSGEFTFNFIKKLCNFMQCSLRRSSLQCNFVDAKPINSTEQNSMLLTIGNGDFSCTYDSNSSPHAQLQLIISELEIRNRELHRILLLGTHNEREIRKYLEEHKSDIAAQIMKLKTVKEYLQIGLQKPALTETHSTPMVGIAKNAKTNNLEPVLSPILQLSECSENSKDFYDTVPYSVNDLSTWIKDQPVSSTSNMENTITHSLVKESHSELDDALAKLQQILANNFILDESLTNLDNNHLKHAVSEVEDMLTSIIDNVESSRSSSVQPTK